MADRDGPARPGWLWYFAYGSNMDPSRLFEARLAAANVAHGRRRAARLDGWRLAFNKPWARFAGAGVANIVPAPGAVVHGTLNEMPPAGLDVLDRYEGVPAGLYARHAVAVAVPGAAGPVAAVTYVAARGLVEGLKPARAYLAHLLAGRDLLPADYAAALAATECVEAEERES
jgi:gamma-glutamylcyclotransferase